MHEEQKACINILHIFFYFLEEHYSIYLLHLTEQR